MNFVESIIEFFVEAWTVVKDFFKWIINWFFEQMLNAVAYVMESIPAPSFMSNGSLGDTIDPDILWLCGQAGVGEALLILSGAIVFYILRRVLTLGIW